MAQKQTDRNFTKETLDKVIKVFIENKEMMLQKKFIQEKTQLHWYQMDSVLHWLVSYGIIHLETTPTEGEFYKWIGEFNSAGQD